MKLSRQLAVHLVLVLAPAAINAATLGAPRGSPVLNEPMYLEIPLGNAGNIGGKCVRVTPIPERESNQFFPEGTRVTVESRGNSGTFVTLRNALIKQPVIEFRLIVSCDDNNTASRDYVLLPDSPNPTGTAPSAKVPRETPESRQQTSAVAPRPIARTGEISLAQLAQGRYPQQPKAREKFIRLMREANVEQLAGLSDTDAIPDASQLKIPPKLPEQRTGPFVPPDARPTHEDRREAPNRPPLRPAQAEKPPNSQQLPARTDPSPGKDRLTIGTPPRMTTKETETALQRLESINAAQLRLEEEMAARLAQAETTFGALKEHIVALQSNLRAAEQERDRLRRENEEKASLIATLQLALAVLIGGILGAVAIVAAQHHQARKRRLEADSVPPSVEFQPPTRVRPSPPPSAPRSVQEHANGPTTAPASVPSAPSAAAPPTPPANLKDFDFMSWTDDPIGMSAAARSGQESGK